MKQVWKIALVERELGLVLPAGAEVLHFAIQGKEPVFWVLVDPEAAPREDRYFRAVGTGEPFDSAGARYVGTALTEDAAHVWHLFEVPGSNAH